MTNTGKMTNTDKRCIMAVSRDKKIMSEEFAAARPEGIFVGRLAASCQEITRAQLKILLDRGADVVLLNVLSPVEFRQEHIPSSVNMPVEEIERRVPRQFKPDDLIIVYCRSPRCMVSAVAADKLATIGYENVMRFRGGIREWKAAGLPVEGVYFKHGKAA